MSPDRNSRSRREDLGEHKQTVVGVTSSYTARGIVGGWPMRMLTRGVKSGSLSISRTTVWPMYLREKELLGRSEERCNNIGLAGRNSYWRVALEGS